MEIEHVRIAGEAMKKHEKKDPEELFPKGFAHLFEFKSNIDYVRDVLKNQVDLGAMEAKFVPVKDMPKDYRYFKHMDTVNKVGAPSEEVIEKMITKEGKDYRQEIKGPHPVERFRSKK